MSPALKTIVAGLFLSLSLTIVCPTFAQTATPDPNNPTGTTTTTTGDTPDDGKPITPQNYKAPEHANFTLLNIGNGIICEIMGAPYIAGKTSCVGYNNQGEARVYDRLPSEGAMGGIKKSVTALLSTPPTSTTEYIADVGRGFGVVKESYAQAPNQTSGIGGSGDAVLRPVLTLWTVARNLSYMLFIVVFLAVGFMIMFRQKMNPQTVVSIQSALPGLVIGLILVTFSYFISALIVDTSFIGMRLVGFFFAQSGVNQYYQAEDLDKLAQTANVFSMYGVFMRAGNYGDLIASVSQLFSSAAPPDVAEGVAVGTAAVPVAFIPGVGPFLALILGLSGGTQLPGPISGPVGGAIEGMGRAILGIAGGGLGIFFSLVIVLALVIQMFRLIWSLVTCYIAILLTTIFSPLIILYASLPGKGAILSMWWKTLLGNVLVFPAVFGAFLLAGAFMANLEFSNSTLPLFAGITPEILRLILGFGLILSTPSIPKLVKSAIGVKDAAGLAAEAQRGATLAGAAATPIAGGVATGGVRALATATVNTPFGAPLERLGNGLSRLTGRR